MSLRKHPSGSGWQLQKLIPPALRGLWKTRTGKVAPHVNQYVSAKADHRTAKIANAEFEAQWGATFAHLESLPPERRQAFIDAGGLEGVRRRLVALNWQVSAHRHLVAIGNEAHPIEVANEMGMPLADVVTDTYAQRQQLQDLQASANDARVMVEKIEGKPRQLGTGMRDVFDLWVRKKGAKVTRGHKASAERWVAVMGDVPVTSITRQQVQRFYDQNEMEGLGPSAQLKHRDHLKVMLQVATAEGWIDANPAANVTLSAAVNKAAAGGDDDNDDGNPFTPAQLRLILATAAVEWKNDPDKLLALRTLVFTGARASEVCQLRSLDIETIDGVPSIRFREGEGQSLKNRPSRRIVPLHPAIAADVLAKAGDGHEWLFPSFPHDRPRGHATQLQAAFNGRLDKATQKHVGLLRGTCGITDDVSLHSTRDAFIDACRRSGMPEDTERRLVGHGKPDVHARYGKGAGLVALAAAMASVDPLKG